MLKVFLLQPNRVYPQFGGTAPSVNLPVGLLWVAASLEKQGVPVDFFDCQNRPETGLKTVTHGIQLGIEVEVLSERLKQSAPDVVGIGCQFTSQWEGALEAIRAVRTALPRSVIVLGGPHATVCGAEILRHHAEVDFVVAGEGERSMPRLIQALEAGTGFEQVSGLLWRNHTGSIQSNAVQPIEDLDSLPFPAYHLFDFKRYYSLQEQGFYVRGKRQRSVSLITSRGCPFTCVFCSIHLSMGYKVRAHSADYTIRHMRRLIDEYGVQNLQIEDDNFTFQHHRVAEICQRMVDEKLSVTWETPNGVRADMLTDDLFPLLKQSGCSGLAIAAESGDQRVLDTIVKKRLKLDSIEKTALLAQRHKIPIGCFFVIGFPGETRANIQTTLNFALRLYRKYNCMPMVNIATPLPGTELTRVAQEMGYLDQSLTPESLSTATSISGYGLIRTEEFGPEFLHGRCQWMRKRQRILRAFYLLRHPAGILESVCKRIAPRRLRTH